MKVVILGTRGFPGVLGGVEKHCEHLAVKLVEAGCEVIVLTRKPYVDTNISEYKGVKLIALPAIRNKFLEAIVHTFIGIFHAKKLKPDVLHIQAIGPSVLTPLAKLLGMNVVVTTHGSNYKHNKWGGKSKKFLQFCEKVGMKHAREVIAISPLITEEVVETYNRPVHFIPNGVVLPELFENDDFLKKHNLQRGKYFLALGRFVPEKGFHDLVEAFIQASSANKGTRFDEYKLVIAGDADHEDEYSRKLKERAASNPNIVLTGFVKGEPLEQLLRFSGLFVLPSYYEGLSVALLEAMSYGLDCLVSDIPANVSVPLTDDSYFKKADVDELAEKLADFVENHKEGIVNEAYRTLLREEYDWAKIAEKTRDVYQMVL